VSAALQHCGNNLNNYESHTDLHVNAVSFEAIFSWKNPHFFADSYEFRKQCIIQVKGIFLRLTWSYYLQLVGCLKLISGLFFNPCIQMGGGGRAKFEKCPFVHSPFRSSTVRSQSAPIPWLCPRFHRINSPLRSSNDFFSISPSRTRCPTWARRSTLIIDAVTKALGGK
jgi:hypothetical protein